jgi:trimethylamine:corrinoid methyltransferase-like protein
MDRRPYNVWEEKRDNASDWALEKARSILKNHQPEVLDPKLDVEMDKIIKSLETNLSHATSH